MIPRTLIWPGRIWTSSDCQVNSFRRVVSIKLRLVQTDSFAFTARNSFTKVLVVLSVDHGFVRSQPKVVVIYHPRRSIHAHTTGACL